MKSRKRRTCRKALRYLAPLAIISIALLLCGFRYGFPKMIQARIDILPDSRAESGVLHGGTGPIESGEYQIVLNQIPTVKAGSRDCNIEFENPSGNRLSSRINLYLKSTGVHIGDPRRVDPGNYVEKVRLKEKLQPGEYQVLADIELFEEKKPAGGMTLELTLRVVEDLDG